jgi:hypothetical protein
VQIIFLAYFHVPLFSFFIAMSFPSILFSAPALPLCSAVRFLACHEIHDMTESKRVRTKDVQKEMKRILKEILVKKKNCILNKITDRKTETYVYLSIFLQHFLFYSFLFHFPAFKTLFFRCESNFHIDIHSFAYTLHDWWPVCCVFFVVRM